MRSVSERTPVGYQSEFLMSYEPNTTAYISDELQREQNRLIYLFEPQDTDDRVTFDLNTFKYVEVSQAAEIPGKLKPELIAILQDAGAVINGGTS